ncbi:hypothetical protein DM01DRAFT_1380194 [Hesseltinella vesiculosa]|uniref:SLS1 N-terminal domain-containing protein n=1 Tax=Hesseltinella vesiculosa TaxID=101127 RepID=A0A1X2GWL9_9FUNG|nr:hypothetical protein DM01DRAFT_1380194 [Hesseltinella vesiculosa]
MATALFRHAYLKQFYQRSAHAANNGLQHRGIASSLCFNQHHPPVDAAVLDEIKSLRPAKPVLPTETQYNKLESELGSRFNVPQLKLFIRQSGRKPMSRKAELIQQILEDWQVTTRERQFLQQERDRKHTIQHQIQLAPDELFFAVSDNGQVFRDIEARYPSVNIMINIADGQCTLVSPKRSMEPVKKAVQDALALERQQVRLTTPDQSTTPTFQKMTQPLLDDMSTLTGVYLSLDNDKISMTAKSKEKLDRAKRMLAVLMTDHGLTTQPSLQSADVTLIQRFPASTSEPLCLLPLHDSATMPLTMSTLGWSRLAAHGQSQENAFSPLDGRSTDILTELGIKEHLEKTLSIEEDSNGSVRLEALFGHLLFENPADQPIHPNLLVPGLQGSFDVNGLQKFFQTPGKHRRFYTGNPSNKVRSSLVPLPLNEGFHRRVVKVDYIASSRVGRFVDETDARTSWSTPLERLQLAFVEQQDGSLVFDQVVGSRKHTMIDLLQLGGNVDVRLVATRLKEFDQDLPSPIQDLINECRLASFSDLRCPDFWDQHAMTLLGITFNNESRYKLGDNEVTLNYISEQETCTRRAEMKMTSMTQGLDQWPSFWSSLVSLANQWSFKK